MREFRIPKWVRSARTLGPLHDPTAQTVWSWTLGDRQKRFWRRHLIISIGTDYWCWCRIEFRLWPRWRSYRWTLMEDILPWAPYDPRMWVLGFAMAQYNALEDDYVQHWADGEPEMYGQP